jgi:hypothetical protein
VKHLALAILLTATSAHAEDFTRPKVEAVAAHAADIATTGAGLALGAAEANPLGLLLVPAKAVAYHRIKASPEVEQPGLWAAYEAMGWGAAANNACVIAAVSTGGPAIVPCLAVGGVAAALSWTIDQPRRQRLEFEAICAEAQSVNPDLRCTWHD